MPSQVRYVQRRLPEAAQPQRNRDTAAAVGLLPKDLLTILRSNGMGTDSTEPEMLTKMKAVTVTTPNTLVNVKDKAKTTYGQGMSIMAHRVHCATLTL